MLIQIRPNVNGVILISHQKHILCKMTTKFNTIIYGLVVDFNDKRSDI